MRRRAVIVAVWVAGTVASVALAWTAVSAVGGEVTSTPPSGAALAAEQPSSSTTTTTTSAPATPQTSSAPSPTTTATTTAPPPVERRSDVYDSVGGTVGASCTGAAASLDFATPRAGYTAEVHDTGPEKVDVRFDAGSGTESRVDVRCVDGTPTAEVREDS